MKKIIIWSLALVMLITPLTVSATGLTEETVDKLTEETTESGTYSYYVVQNFCSDDGIQRYKDTHKVYGSVPIALYCFNVISDGAKQYRMAYYDVNANVLRDLTSTQAYVFFERYDYEQGKITDSREGIAGQSFITSDLATVETNIPMFDNKESALAYLRDEDDSGMINIPEPPIDETFYLEDFEADNNVTAIWSGTSHGDKADTYAEMYIDLVSINGFTSDSEFYGKEVKNLLHGEYPISEKTLTILFEELKKYCTLDGEYVSCLEFKPYYKVENSIFSPTYKGRSAYVYFDDDGDIISVENGVTELYEDNDFYLTGVKTRSTVGAVAFTRLENLISWTGVSDVSALIGVPNDKTHVSVIYSYRDAKGNIKYDEYNLKDFYSDLLHDTSYVRICDKEVLINTQKIIDLVEKQGYTFTGEIWLTPYYAKNNDMYEGGTTCINVLTGEITQIGEDEKGNPVETPVAPPKDEIKPVTPGTDGNITLPTIGNATDIFSYLFNLFSSLYNYVGLIPDMVGRLFSFIPSAILEMIVFALMVVIALRILGR